MPERTANVTLCQAYGNCATNASDVYDIDDNGKVVVLLKDFIDDADRTRVAESARSPVNALRVED